MRMRPSLSSGWSIGALFAAAMFGAVAAWAQNAPVPTQTPPPTTNVSVPPATPNPAPLKAEEIDALVAPVALYPDNLLAQVLIASTYPLEIAMAAQWRMQNPNLQGEQLTSALQTQTWDASVKALAEVPTALDQMFQRLDWTQKLGDAFLAQQKEVMDSVQRLRERAQGAGKLMSTDQQKVTTENQTIVIEQADPQTIYVPYYDPYYMYGGWPYAGYPPYYWPAPPGYAFGAGLVFGLGIAIAGGAWNNWVDWNGGNINVDINRDRFTNIDRNTIANRRDNANSQRWQHNADHRLGTNYRDQATRERFGQGNAAQANARRDFRGFEGGGQLGDRAGQVGDRGQLGQRTGFERSGQAGGFDGVGRGNATRDFSSRGAASRQSMAANRGFSGGGRSFSGGGFRGGGGGGFRGGGGGRR